MWGMRGRGGSTHTKQHENDRTPLQSNLEANQSKAEGERSRAEVERRV